MTYKSNAAIYLRYEHRALGQAMEWHFGNLSIDNHYQYIPIYMLQNSDTILQITLYCIIVINIEQCIVLDVDSRYVLNDETKVIFKFKKIHLDFCFRQWLVIAIQ